MLARISDLSMTPKDKRTESLTDLQSVRDSVAAEIKSRTTKNRPIDSKIATPHVWWLKAMSPEDIASIERAVARVAKQEESA